MKALIISMCISFIITPALAEFALFRGVDPWGAFAYYSDMAVLRQHYEKVDDKRAYILPPGIIELRGWKSTMTDTGRAVPASGNGACTVAFIGDSFTYGHGVNDVDTFANQIAGRFPDQTTLNLGMNGYNTEQVLASVNQAQADIFVYLLIGNDAEPVMKMAIPQPIILHQGFKVYHYHWQQMLRKDVRSLEGQQLPNIPNWFIQSMTNLAQRDNVLIVGFADNVLTTYVNERIASLALIPYHTNPLSKADGHPNPDGHKHIANAIVPYLTPLIDQHCSEVLP